MATKKTTVDEEIVESIAEEYDPNEKVDVRVPRSTNPNDPGVYVSVNGVSFLLPHGKTSSVPRFIADEYERMQRAEAAYYDKIDAMVKASK